MRILFWGHVELDIYNACRTHAVSLCRGLQEAGHEVVALLPRSQGATSLSFSYEPLFFKGFGPFKETVAHLANLPKIVGIARTFCPDVVYSRELFHPAPVWLCRRLGVPLFVEVNGWHLDELRLAGASPWHLAYLKWVQRVEFTGAHGIVSVTDKIADRIRRAFGVPQEKLLVAENGVDTNLFRPQPQRMCRDRLGMADGFWAGYVGGFYPWHDIATALQAIALLKKAGKTARLLLVGPCPPSVRRLVERLSLQSLVRISGVQPHERIPLFMNALDVCLLPYAFDTKVISGSPVKLYEYFGCAKPVVLSDHFFFRSFRRMALLVPPSDPEALAQALQDLRNSPAKRDRLGGEARKYVEAERTWRRAAERIVAFMAERIHTRPPASATLRGDR